MKNLILTVSNENSSQTVLQGMAVKKF
jgi:hypothetical protein